MPFVIDDSMDILCNDNSNSMNSAYLDHYLWLVVNQLTSSISATTPHTNQDASSNHTFDSGSSSKHSSRRRSYREWLQLPRR